MSLSNKIQLGLAIVTTISTLIALISVIIAFYFSRKNLQLSYKANIVFFIEQPDSGSMLHKLTFKNFGKSCGTLLYMNISPELPYEKYNNIKDRNFTKSKNIFLTPGETRFAKFPIKDCGNKVFKVEVVYECDGKTYKNKYTIDLTYTDSILI